MESKAFTKIVRISPFKTREITRLIQGKDYDSALNLVTFSSKKAATVVKKTLKSARANAENNHNFLGEELFVKLAVVEEGPTIKRFKTKARGMAGKILKRTSHIRIILSDELVN